MTHVYIKFKNRKRATVEVDGEKVTITTKYLCIFIDCEIKRYALSGIFLARITSTTKQ